MTYYSQKKIDKIFKTQHYAVFHNLTNDEYYLDKVNIVKVWHKEQKGFINLWVRLDNGYSMKYNLLYLNNIYNIQKDLSEKYSLINDENYCYYSPNETTISNKKFYTGDSEIYYNRIKNFNPIHYSLKDNLYYNIHDNIYITPFMYEKLLKNYNKENFWIVYVKPIIETGIKNNSNIDDIIKDLKSIIHI